MQILLQPVGSAGDVHPFVGLGLALKERGHQVVVVTNGYFANLIRRVGLEFVEMGTAEEYRAALDNPDIWHPRRALQVMGQLVVPLVRRVYDLIKERYVPGETVVAASTLSFGSRVAQDKLGVPTVTVHLQPSMILSVNKPPVIAALPMPNWLPRLMVRGLYYVGDKLIADPILLPEINALRRELGLAPVARIISRWVHSPQCVIGLFPEWFAPPQADWPAQVRLTGFPLYDERGATELPATLQSFLDAGSAPFVFTPGSAMVHAKSFFESAVAACQQLGRRGILLTRFAEQVPAVLPDSVRHFEFVPLSQLLPHAAVMVHHGGIGTSAQTLAAGIPHLVLPLSHDQPDNAARLLRLGVARTLKPHQVTSARLAAELSALVESRAVLERCREFANRMRLESPLEETCRLIEGLLPSSARNVDIEPIKL